MLYREYCAIQLRRARLTQLAFLHAPQDARFHRHSTVFPALTPADDAKADRRPRRPEGDTPVATAIG